MDKATSVLVVNKQLVKLWGIWLLVGLILLVVHFIIATLFASLTGALLGAVSLTYGISGFIRSFKVSAQDQNLSSALFKYSLLSIGIPILIILFFTIAEQFGS